MKTKDEVVIGFQSRFISEIGNVWESGYQKGIEEGNVDLQKKIDEAYERGAADGVKSAKDECLNCGEYKRGLEDAWNAVRKLSTYPKDGGLNQKEAFDMFNVSDYHDLFLTYTAMEVIDKLNAYESEKADFRVGDEVIYKDGSIGILTAKANNYYYFLWSNGTSSSFPVEDLKADFNKTGRNYSSFEGLLHAMKEHRDG